MNYDEELYNISKIALEKNNGNDSDKNLSEKEAEKIKNAKIRLLKILTKRFHSEAKKQNELPNMLNIRIKASKYASNEPGYNDIEYLLEKGEFSSFSEDYLIYLIGATYTYDSHGEAYYDLAWDYKKYYLMTLPYHYEKQIKDTANTLADEITKLILQ